MRSLRALALSAALLPAGAGAALAADTYVKSDDYKDGEEVVNVFFRDAEYSRIYEDLERNGSELDWAWVKHDGRRPDKVGTLGFSLGDYQTVRIAPVINKADEILPGIEDDVVRAFTLGFERAGLQVVSDPKGAADLEVQLAIVDLNTSSTYIYFTTVDPFIEMEMKLVDLKSGEELMLVRHQAHGGDAGAAAGSYAGDVFKFLR